MLRRIALNTNCDEERIWPALDTMSWRINLFLTEPNEELLQKQNCNNYGMTTIISNWYCILRDSEFFFAQLTWMNGQLFQFMPCCRKRLSCTVQNRPLANANNQFHTKIKNIQSNISYHSTTSDERTNNNHLCNLQKSWLQCWVWKINYKLRYCWSYPNLFREK